MRWSCQGVGPAWKPGAVRSPRLGRIAVLAELAADLGEHEAHQCLICGRGYPAACPRGTALRHAIAALYPTEEEASGARQP